MCVINFSKRKNFTQTLEVAQKMEQDEYYPPVPKMSVAKLYECILTS